MTDYRILEINYDTSPVNRDIPQFDGTDFKPKNFLTLINAILPPGTYIPYGGTSDPSGWLICDGRAISRTTYASLFANIGTTYGVGDGSTTFNIPDLRGRFPLGKAAAGTGSTMGQTGGAIDHTHTSAAHTHTVPAHYHGMGTGADFNITSGGAHGHTFYQQEFQFVDPGTFAAVPSDAGAGTAGFGGTGSDGAHTHTTGTMSGRVGLVTGGVDGNAAMTSGSTTPGATGSNNPPYLVGNYIIWTGVQ